MNPLDRFEAACERLVEGSLGRLFRAPLQPAEIGRKLEKAMAANPAVAVDGTLVPNRFAVALHPADLAAFAPYLPALRTQLEGWLTDVAAERGWLLVDRVVVAFDADEGMPRRAVRVDASIASNATDGDLGAGEARQPPREAGPRAVRLRLLDGEERGREILVERTPVRVGRAPDNDVVFRAEDVSRYHARLELVEDGGRVTDLGSTNGTFVNGRRVGTAAFRPGDRIGFGSATAEVLAAGPRPAGR